MQNNNHKFQFKDFNPSYDFMHEADAALLGLESPTQGGAAAGGTLQKVGTSFLCRIEVLLSGCQFNGKALDRSPHAAIARAVRTTKTAIEQWRDCKPLHFNLGEFAIAEIPVRY